MNVGISPSWLTRARRASDGIVSSRRPSSTTARASSQAPERISSASCASGSDVTGGPTSTANIGICSRNLSAGGDWAGGKMQRFLPPTRRVGQVGVPALTTRRFHPAFAGSTTSNQQKGAQPVAVVSMRELLEAGVHFGHQTRRWNPKMKRFIFGERGGIYIIDLQQTLERLEDAAAFARNLAERGGPILFVGTKKQAMDAVAEQAERVGM